MIKSYCFALARLIRQKIIFGLFLMPLLAKAEELAIDNPLSGVTDIPTLLKNVTNYILGISGTLMVMVLIIAGIRYITAGANTSRANEAKKMLKWAIAGILLVLGAFAILNTIINALSGG